VDDTPMSQGSYRSRTEIPSLVQWATDLTVRHEFDLSCIAEVGRLLSVLASHIQGGVVGEIGTGTGVGAAWMLSHLAPSTRFVTVEADAARATAARDLFKKYPNAEVIHGDWRAILSRSPFDLLFVDVGEAKRDEPQAVVEALRLGGMAVMDDFTPEEYWPEDWRGKPDPVRTFWLNDVRLNAVEVRTTPTTMAILATRIG